MQGRRFLLAKAVSTRKENLTMVYIRFNPQEDITAFEAANCINIVAWGLGEAIQRGHAKEWSMEEIFPGYTVNYMTELIEKFHLERHFEISPGEQPIIVEVKRGNWPKSP